jgi:hypothetical protein
MYFDWDDMMNLHVAWSKPLAQVLWSNAFFWNGFYRPLGATFYRGMFALAGFNPMPFRIVALAFCVFNIGLCFWFTRLVSGSERIAALAALIFAFHPRLIDVWFRTAVIYDVLCFTFIYLAACLYIAERREGRDLSAGRIAAIVVCFILALDAKEMAVCLPVFLAAYELLWSRKPGEFMRSRASVLIGVLALMTVVYMIGKLHGPDSMVNNPFYKPEYSYTRFANTWSANLGHLMVMDGGPKGWVSMTIVGGLLAIALGSRSRKLILAWVIIFFGLMPVSFSPPRAGFAIYVSWVGWALYAAIVLVALQDLITTRPQYRTALACVVFVLVGWRFGKFNLHLQRIDPRHGLYDPPAAVREMSYQMRALHPAFPAKARMLFVDDAFPATEWTPLFMVQLLYDDPSLTVDRLKMMTAKPANWDGYEYVFTYEGKQYRQLKPQ